MSPDATGTGALPVRSAVPNPGVAATDALAPPRANVVTSPWPSFQFTTTDPAVNCPVAPCTVFWGWLTVSVMPA